MILQNQNISMTELFNLIGETSDGGGTNSAGTLMAKTNAVLNKADQIITKINESSNSGSTGGYTSGMQTFTSNGTFTVPNGVNIIYVTACGGGGAGAAGWGYYTCYGGGGGGGGALCYKRPFQVTPGQQISITVGAGGKGAAFSRSATTNKAANGGSTVIGSLITLPGGTGGGGCKGPTSDGGYGFGPMSKGGAGGAGAGGGGNGTVSGGNSVLYGIFLEGSSLQTFSNGAANGGNGISNTASGGQGQSSYSHTSGTQWMGGGGGGGSLGKGGDGGPGSSSPVAGGAGGYGAGGGGGAGYWNGGSTFAGGTGGNGGNGIVIIEW